MKKQILKSSIVVVLLVIYSCKKSEVIEVKTFHSEPVTEIQNDNEAPTYHTDADYKYEYRIGDTDNYKYNYDVTGSDSNGDEVNGNVSVEGKYGSGTITDTNGNTFEVEVEWIDYGKLKAVDENEAEYELEVD
jgi:replication-associated recombination protein RarA